MTDSFYRAAEWFYRTVGSFNRMADSFYRTAEWICRTAESFYRTGKTFNRARQSLQIAVFSVNRPEKVA